MLELNGQVEYAQYLRVAVVQARFNHEITGRLWAACLAELLRLGVPIDQISYAVVPGALEIPFALRRLAQYSQADVMIAIGAVIRGDTYHFEVVSNESARALMDLTLQTNLPVINAVLTTNDDAQAIARSHVKGIEAAQAAVEMASLNHQLQN